MELELESISKFELNKPLLGHCRQLKRKKIIIIFYHSDTTTINNE